MAKSKPGAQRGRGQKAAPSPKPADKPAPKKKVGPVEFVRQVRAEGARTTWPTRKETGVTTMMVFIMVAVAAVFFVLVDLIIQTGVGFILEMGS